MTAQADYQEKVKTLLPRLLTKINATVLPFNIPVLPEADAEVNSCFYNVERKVRRDGGTACYGWAIRFTPYIIEAEKHAVWKSSMGQYVDVTPNVRNSENVYFVIDRDFTYTGQVVDNIRLNVTGEIVVDDWIMISEAIHQLYSFGHRVGEHEIRLPENIGQAIHSLEEYAKVFAPFLDAGGSYHGPCFCGRPLSYHKCHGLDLKKTLNELTNRASLIKRG